uniref:Reverse transcriptase domain-containing protein n=1 Tax=Cuerna arida TaxID=1464854 RepID=A0A1B6EQJ1_9HEMI
MYADDTVITTTEKNKEQIVINTDRAFTATKEYCVPNHLVLNKEKTVQVVFKTKDKNADVGIAGIDLKTNTKYLGIVIDSNLSWKPHVDQLCKKLSSGTYLLRRLNQVCTPEVTRTAYLAFFESHIRYGIASWGGTTSANLERVLLQQKRAVRCLASLGYRESCLTAFADLKILTVVALYIQEVILHTVFTLQPRHQNIHHHNTRHASNFVLPPHHLSLFSKKPTYAGAKLFNLLPEELKNMPAQQLKKQLTDWLTKRPFYSIDEFTKGDNIFNN